MIFLFKDSFLGRSFVFAWVLLDFVLVPIVPIERLGKKLFFLKSNISIKFSNIESLLKF